MPHDPVHYDLYFRSAAQCAALEAPVNDGDTAIVLDATGFPRTYVYHAAGVAADADGLQTIAGPNAVGLWEYEQLKTSVTMRFIFGGGALTLEAKSDPSLRTGGVSPTLGITHSGTGDFLLVFNAGSILRPSAAEPFFGAILVSPNIDGCGFASASWDDLHTIRVRTANASGLPDAPVFADMGFSLSVGLPGF